MIKILLLGAAGQLGSDILDFTSSNNIAITPIIRSEFDAGLHDPHTQLAQYADHDYLINCIAYHKVDECESNLEQSSKINVEFPQELSKYCNQHNQTLIHISTDYVFDGKKDSPYSEDDHPAPINVYGNSKLAGEIIVRASCKKYFILRISSLFGSKPSDNPGINFVEKMLHSARNNQPLKVIDDQIMSPTHAKDVALAIKALIEKEANAYSVYHACNSGHTSWYNFAKTIFDLASLDANMEPISYEQFHSKAKRPKYCAMDNRKIISYYEMPPWQEALTEYMNLRKHI